MDLHTHSIVVREIMDLDTQSIVVREKRRFHQRSVG